MTNALHPALYQINTRVWLTELSEVPGRQATLDDIPDAELDRLVQLRDLLSSAHYHRDGNELLESGLYLDIPPWSYHVFDLEINQRT